MANIDRRAGLTPVQYQNGNPWNGQGRTYFIPQTDTNQYAIGDPLTLAGDADPAGIPSVTIVTAGGANAVLGSLLGYGSSINGGVTDPAQINTTIIPAAKTHGYYVMVADDPNIIFEVQEVGTGTFFTSAEVGLNCSLVASAGANNSGNNGFVSGWMLDNTTEATTATLQMKIMGLVQRTDNTFGQFAKFLAKINNHIFAGGTAGI